MNRLKACEREPHSAAEKKLRAVALAVLLLIQLLGDVGRSAAQLDVPSLWNARFSAYRGDPSCTYGSRDCNRCVNNVVEQFKNLTQRGAHTERIRHWSLNPTDPYPPSFQPPDTVITPNFIAGHFQSFVRAPTDPTSDTPNLFASYSNRAIFGARAASEAGGRTNSGSLKYHWRAAGEHPGGIQAIGHWLLVATEDTSDGKAKLEILDLDAPLTPARVLELPEIGAKAANVAVTKVAGGGYLILVERSSYDGTDYRLYFTASLANPHLEVVLPKVTSDWNTGIKDGDKVKNVFENLSIITECGTGTNYVIGTTAPEAAANDGLTALYPWGQSFWALYELVPGTDTVLRFITKNTNDMFSPECDPRGSGTAFAGRHGELGLYCHQKNDDATSRRDIVGCALSTVFGFVTMAMVFCGMATTSDSQKMFTEFWPTSPPTEPSVEITVRVYPHTLNTGVIENTTGLICRATTVPTTCKWTVPQGQELTLVPFRAGGIQYSDAFWIGESTEAAGGPCLPYHDAQGTPTACHFMPQEGLTVGLLDYVLL